jgi:phenylacetate-CoA ligase
MHKRWLWPRHKLRRWKLARLSQLVDYAYLSTSFYRAKYDEIGFTPGDIRSYDDFRQLPLVHRDDLIREFPHGIVSRQTNISKCRRVCSSGSSGKPVQMLVTQRRADLDTFFKYRQFELMSGFRLPPDRWLYNIHHSLWWYTSFLGQYPVFSLCQACPPASALHHIRQLRPIVVASLASTLHSLAELGVELRSCGVRLISTNSESSTLEERCRWERIFGVPIRDEYSSEELDIVAHQCEAGTYHVVEDDCHLESLDQDDAGVGNVVGTDLWNRAMPIIRYWQGDLIRINEKDKCLCGSGTRIVAELHGRLDQAFTSKTLGRITPGNLMELCDSYLSPAASGVHEFRLIQRSIETVELLYVPRKGIESLDSAHLVGFKRSLARLFGYAPYLRITRLNEIPILGGYKRRSIICELGQE